MAANLISEIAAQVARLPLERQREALALVEQLAARTIVTSKSSVPRVERQLKGSTATDSSVSSDEIREARGEMWGDYTGGDEAA